MIGREETVSVIETTIDDMNPEIYSYLLEKLIGEGALDAYATPVYMKKTRPGNLLTVICRRENTEQLLELIFRETTTLGVRLREEKRRVLKRCFAMVSTPWGDVNIKIGYTGENERKILQAAPEYEECKKIAENSGTPLKEIYTTALAAFEKIKIDKGGDLL